MRVWRLRRATSYLPCFSASWARSKSTLSGCLESMFAMGLTGSLLFLCFLLLECLVAGGRAVLSAVVSAGFFSSGCALLGCASALLPFCAGADVLSCDWAFGAEGA